jgi:ABC-type sugar transport system permease subunit
MTIAIFVGYAFVAPWLVGFCVFTLGPFLTSVYLSFTRYDIVSSPKWIGVLRSQGFLRFSGFCHCRYCSLCLR